MHNFDRVVCIFFTPELYESITLIIRFHIYLVLSSDFILGNMNVDNWSTLGEELPYNVICDFGIEGSNINSCFLISFIKRRHNSS